MCTYIIEYALQHTRRGVQQAEAEAQRNRADALERERDMLAKQLADLRERLAKALRELDEARAAMENMVPRYALVPMIETLR